jgi:surface antigen
MRSLSILLATTLAAGAGLVGIASHAAGAATLDYPNANAVPHRPQAPYYEWWVDENGDGRRQLPGELISGRGYPYRNATDYVAWRLEQLGVTPSRTRGPGAAGTWAMNAPARGVEVRTTPVRYGAAVKPGAGGQVAFVTSVLADGRITVDEYNADGTGTGRTWTGLPAGRGFTRFLDFGLAIGRLSDSPIAVARNADGRLEVFAVQASGAAMHAWQISAGGAWTGWAPFGGTFTTITAESNADGRLEAFAAAADGTVFHRSQITAGSAWSAWEPMEGRLATLALARSYDGKLQLFGADPSHAAFAMTQLSFGGPWSVWQRFDGSVANVAAETNADGRSEVFAVTPAGAIVHRRQNLAGGTWGAWTRITGGLRNVTSARSFDGRLEVFGSNAAHTVYHASQTQPAGALSAWTPFASGRTSVAAETNADGRVEVFGVAANGIVSHTFQAKPGGAWSNWLTMDGGLRVSLPAPA